MRRLLLWITVPAAALLLLTLAAWPGSSTFTVGPETTYVTGPLDKRGDVDYVAALNERLRKGVTPENNSNVLIWRALGPHPEGGTMPAEYFHWLGVGPPPEKGEYLVSWQNYLREHAKVGGKVGNAAVGNVPLQVPNGPWAAKEKPELAGWLKRNEKPLALVTEAVRRSEYYNPLVPGRTGDWSPGLLSALLPTVQKCRELAAAFASRALLRLAEGKVEEAWQDLVACHRLARLLARGATLIELLVGIAIEQIANRSDLAFVEHAKLTSKQLMARWEELAKLPPMPNLADKVDYSERFMLLDVVMLTVRHGTPFLDNLSGPRATPPKSTPFTSRLFSRSIHWDPAFRKVNHWYDRCAAALRIADRTERSQKTAEIEGDLKTLKQQAANLGFVEKLLMGPSARGDWIGNILVGLMMPAIHKVQDAADRSEQGRRNLSLAFALAAYQRDKKRYPENLDELDPTYLKSIPNDLFSGKPLLYRRQDAGFLLYSVGVNGTDDCGRGPADVPPGDDLSVRMPARPQK